MERILFIHGFGGDKTSSTGQNVKKVLKDMDVDFTFITDTFELLDYNGTLSKIDFLVKENNISLIISHSFGAFYTLCYKGNVKKILINPCMEPSVAIPPLMKTPTEEELKSYNKYFNCDDSLFIKQYEKAEKDAYSNVDSSNKIFGIFAKNDELFSCKDKFTSLYATNKEDNSIRVEGGHKIGVDSLKIALPKAITYINS